MVDLVVRGTHTCAQPIDLMWRVLAEPELSSTIDGRVSLLSSSGEPGTVGSSYILRFRTGGRAVTTRLEVVDAEPPHLLTARTTVRRSLVVQTGQLVAVPGGTFVTWTVTQRANRLVALLSRRRVERELARWLAGAERVAAGLAS